MRSSGALNEDDKDGAPKTRRKPGRIPTSCAECRRLKLRCDKAIPCEKCVSRGCGAICPDGSLTPGKGNRLVLANTEELHEKIDTLCSRIRELECALQTARGSDQGQHPIVEKEAASNDATNTNSTAGSEPALTNHNGTSSNVSSPPGSDQPSSDQVADKDEESFVDSFGTLTFSACGQSNFYGRTARSELLIRASEDVPSRTMPLPSRLSKQIVDASHSERPSLDSSSVQEAFRFLPPLSEAIRLCETYQDYGKFMYTSIPRTELFDEILTCVYRAESYETFKNFDSLALLFSVFALGAHFDPTRQPYSVESQEFFYLSRAALQYCSRPSRVILQAHIHIAQYLEFTDWESAGLHDTWMYVGKVVRLAQSGALHINSARWNLSETNTQRRNCLFWQLFHLDTWTSFHLGRQSTMSPSYIDWPLPRVVEDSNTKPDSPRCFDAWNWRYSALLHSLMATSFGPRQPTYITVLTLDRQIRDFPVHQTWRPACDGAPVGTELNMVRWLALSAKETTLLHLHRAYFVKAVEEMPNELMKHRYTPSVMSVYRSAWRLLRGLRMVWDKEPQVISRINLPWSQAISAAIVICLLVTRSNIPNLSQSALTELDNGLNLFKEAAPTARPAANLLKLLQSLHKKAHDVLKPSHRSSEDSITDTELDRWAGQTHALDLIGSFANCISRPSASPTYIATGAEYWSDTQVDSMHPILAQDMRNFENRSPTFDWLLDPPFACTSQPILQQDLQMGDPNLYSPSDYPGFQPQPQHSAFLPTAPILDATWQTFAEQLGF